MQQGQKLKINARTVRELNSADLGRVVGGQTAVGTNSGACISQYGDCTTSDASECGGCLTFWCCDPTGSCI